MFAEMAASLVETMTGHVPVQRGLPGRFSVWLRFVRYQRGEAGAPQEETVGNTARVFLTATSARELYEQLAENILLKVFGDDVQVVKDLPNLVLRIGERKARIHVAGAPPPDQPDQVFLKVTVYEYQPSLWERLLGGAREG